MGLFGRAKEAQQQWKDAVVGAGATNGAASGGSSAANGGSWLVGAGNVDEKLRYRELAQKLSASGVEAPGVITTITPGEQEFGGSVSAVFEVTIAPADGDPFPATIKQSMLQAAIDDLSTGDAITVRYDPAQPTAALIYSW